MEENFEQIIYFSDTLSMNNTYMDHSNTPLQTFSIAPPTQRTNRLPRPL